MTQSVVTHALNMSFARWAALLAVASRRAYASSLLELPPAAELHGEQAAPSLHELLADGR